MSANLNNRIQGSIVALVTPMLEDKSIDFDSFHNLLNWHKQSGTDAVIIAGTTGESATLSTDEHCKLISLAVEYLKDSQMAVIAGSGSNATDEAIYLTEHAAQAGAHASLQVVPYYNKPTQKGIYQHFEKIARAVDLPIILYNVPGRTVVDFKNDFILELAEIDNICGIKDATGDVGRGISLIHKINKIAKTSKFSVYSGDDLTAAALMLMGAQGNISVTANVAPKLMKQLCSAAMAGQVSETCFINNQLHGFNKNLFIESNPIPCKYALSKLGKINNVLRLPLTNLDEQYEYLIDEALKQAKLLDN